MNEECLLKYLLNPNELEVLTKVLQNYTSKSEKEISAKPAIAFNS